MWPDVIDLRNFYATPLGHVAQRMIRRKIREFWPTLKGHNLMGLGYATPYLRYYREEARHIAAFMPAEQGALTGSQKSPSLTVLTEETQLPLADKSVDFALVVHALEFTSHPREMIRDIWRVLGEDGRLLLVVPNRSSLWAHREETPFAQGHTYRLSHLIKVLEDNMFTPLRREYALSIPPSHSRLFLRTAKAWEKVGQQWFRTFSGVLLIEASKMMYGESKVKELTWEGKLRLREKLAMANLNHPDERV